MGVIDNIYGKSPVFVQNAFVSVYGYLLKNKRYGELFRKKCIEFKERESWTHQQFRDYQTITLRKLLLHAFNTVPFYRERYTKHGFTVSDFEKFEIEDLTKLPYLEKEDLRKFGATTLLSSKKQKGQFVSTGGSTGTPALIYYSKDFFKIWAAVYETRVRHWAGVDYSMRRGMIGGKKVVTSANAKPPFYRYNAAEGQTYFSAYHISEQNLESYIEGILKNKVEYMVGYALSNYFLADLLVKRGIELPNIKAVLTSSEKLTPEMRATFQKAYQCRTFDAYSGVEACGLISENLEGDFLFSPDVGIMETLEAPGREEKEIVSTGLLNFDQPLIRYRIGDLVKVAENQQTKSGIEMLKIAAISGRTEDAIVTKDGRRIISLYRLFLDIPYLKMAQVVQLAYDDFEINVVTESGFSQKEEESIKTRFFEKIGTDVALTVRKVADIERTASGKYKLTISKLKTSHG